MNCSHRVGTKNSGRGVVSSRTRSGFNVFVGVTTGDTRGRGVIDILRGDMEGEGVVITGEIRGDGEILGSGRATVGT